MFGFNPLFCVFVRRHLSDVELKKTPYAFVAVNLTDHEQITGFIFSAVFLSQRFQIGLERILNLGEAIGGYQDPTKCAAFDQAVTELRDVLQTEIGDVEIIEKYREVFHLADSINSQHLDEE